METIFYRIMKISIFAILASLTEFISAETQLRATTIVEPPYVITKKDNPTSNKDFTGYIPDLLEKLANHTGCECKFNLKLVADGKYGMHEENVGWNGMIGEVLRGQADLIAAPITYSDERSRVINFTEHYMTFETVVLMKKSASMERINSPIEMSDHSEIQYLLVKDGFTENFFKRSDKQFYKDMYAKMDKDKLPRTSKKGVETVQKGDGKHAFMIDSSTADYWVNKKPCDLYSFRLGSALGCHKYAFAVKREPSQNNNNNNLWSRLQRALHALKSNGELERLRAKWWPHECSAAAAQFNITGLNVLVAIITIISARRLY